MVSPAGKLLFSAVSLLFVLFGVGIIAFGRKVSEPVRAMGDTERTPAGYLSPGGTVEVAGTARPAEEGTVETPMRGREALAAVTEVQRRIGGNEPGWHSIHAESPRVPFVVEDDTGEVRVEPPDDVRPTAEFEWTELDTGDEPPAHVREYVDGLGDVASDPGIDLGPVTTGPRRRFGEAAIEPGDEVHVLGEAVAGDADHEVVVTDGQDADFIYSTVDAAELERSTSKLVLAIYAFGALWVLVTLLAAFVPWLAG